MSHIGHHTRAVYSGGRGGQGYAPEWIRGLVVVLLLLALGLVRPSPAAEFTCSAEDVDCLIDAINQANATGETNSITLEAGTYKLKAASEGPPANSGLPAIRSPLTIRGANAATTIIERDPSAPPFRLLFIAAEGTFTLAKLSLRGGRGGLFNQGMLSLHHVIVADNFADFGGGLANQGTVDIRQTVFTGNMVGTSPGGGIFNDGGIMHIRQTTFADNVADAGGGLALAGGAVMLTDSAFVDNTAGVQGGGGLFIEGDLLTMTNSTVARNWAELVGGGLLSDSGTTHLTNVTVAANYTTTSPPRGGPGGILVFGGAVS
jgi:hypothetical protein